MQLRSSPSPAAALRQLMTTSFSLDEVRTLCFDLGIDYETLSGDDKSSKIVELIQFCGRSGRAAELVDQCRKARPGDAWNAIGVEAASNPGAFSFVPVDTAKPLLNASPDRAAKLGFAAGALALLLFVCGFGGGVVAGNLVDVTFNPVQPDPSRLEQTVVSVDGKKFTAGSVGRSHLELLQQAVSGRLPSGTPIEVAYNNVEMTTLLDELIRRSPGVPVSDVHARFLASKEGVLNFKLGGSRVVIAYTASIRGKRLVIEPTRAVVQIIEQPQSRFGWVPVPVTFARAFTDWAQGQLDVLATRVSFERVNIGEDRASLRMVTR